MCDKHKIDEARQTASEYFRDAVEHDSVFSSLYARIFEHDENEHYMGLSLEDVGKVSYAAKPIFKYDARRRIKTTLQRYLLRQFDTDKLGVSDSELDSFCRRFWKTHTADTSIELVNGEDITEAYVQEFGGSSCMTGDAKCVELYELNTSVVSLLKYQRAGCEARALVWQTTDNQTVVDRIYPNDGAHVDAIHEYALSRGWWVRADNSLPSGTTYFRNGAGETCGDFRVRVKACSYMPYLDSFGYGDDDCGAVILSCNDSEGTFEFHGTDGSSSGSSTPCFDCDCRLSEDEQIRDGDGDIFCSDCYYQRYVTCDNCGEDTSHDNAYNVDDSCYCEQCYLDNFSGCDRCGKGTPHDELTTVRVSACHTYDEKQWCERCARNNTFTCDVDEELYAWESRIETEDGYEVASSNANKLWTCKTCFEQYLESCPCNGETSHEMLATATA